MPAASASLKPSVYKKQGAPLSEAAQYQAKLKSGVYHNPGQASLGLDSKDSGTKAALLAAKANLAIHPYQRETSADAASAALAAKVDPKRFSAITDSPKPSTYSTSAASAVRLDPRIKKSPSLSSESSLSSLSPTKGNLSFSAASNAKDASNKALNDKSYSITSDSSYSTSAAKSLLTPAHPSKSLQTNNTAKSISSSTINYEKLNARAQKTASSLIFGRTEPVKDYRHGLPASGASPSLSSASTTTASPIDYGKLTQKASKNASTLLSNAEKPEKDFRHGIITDKADYDASHAASGALAVEGFKPKDEHVSSESRYSKIDKNVLAIARANATKALQGIDKSHQGILFTNKDFNETAIRIAQKRREERGSAAHKDKYDLGGGLYMPYSDVEAIARKHVDPVLADIEAKAAEQRKLDEEYAREQARLKQEKEEHEAMLLAQKLEAKKEYQEEKSGHKEEIRKEKERYINKRMELMSVKEKEMANQKELVAALAQKYKLTMEQLNKQKAVTEDAQYKELTEFKYEKQAELKKLNEENTAKLKPIIEKLDTERRAYEDLVQEHEALEAIAELDQEKLNTAEKLLAKSKEQLEKSESDLKNAEADLEKAQNDTEKFAAQAEVDRLKTEVEAKITVEKESQAVKKQALYESEKSNQDVLKNKKAIELKNGAVQALEDEKKFAELHPGVNDNKIKALEAEIKDLEKREQEHLQKEERKKFDEAFAKHEETIRGLDEQKQALLERENAILAELKESDENWTKLHSQVEELNISDDDEEAKEAADEKSLLPAETEKAAETVSGNDAEKDVADADLAGANAGNAAKAKDAKEDAVSEHPVAAVESNTGPSAMSVGNADDTTTASATVAPVEPSRKSDNFLNKVVTNLTKTPKPAESGSAVNTSPNRRKRGFSLSNLLKKDSNTATNKSSPQKESGAATTASGSELTKRISGPKFVPRQGISNGFTTSPTGEPVSTTSELLSDEANKNNELKHLFTNFTQGSEVDENEEMDKLFGRPTDGKEKAVFTEDV